MKRLFPFCLLIQLGNQTLSLWKHSSYDLLYLVFDFACFHSDHREEQMPPVFFCILFLYFYLTWRLYVIYSNACLRSAVSRPSFFMLFLSLTNHQAFTVPKKTKADRFSQVRTKVLDSPGQLSNMMWIKPSCMLFCLFHLILDSGNIQIQILQHSKEKKNSALISLNLHISGTRGHTCTFVNKLITVNRNN